MVEVKCPGCREVVCKSNIDVDQAVIDIVAFHYANEVLLLNDISKHSSGVVDEN